MDSTQQAYVDEAAKIAGKISYTMGIPYEEAMRGVLMAVNSNMHRFTSKKLAAQVAIFAFLCGICVGIIGMLLLVVRPWQ